MKKNFFKRRADDILTLIALIALFFLILLFTSCMSFNKAKRKFGNKGIEIVNVPYEKTIAGDSTTLNLNFADLVPYRPIRIKGYRSGISLQVDRSANLSAVGNCDPIHIRDSIPYAVETVVFREADMGRYVLRSIADQEKEQAIAMAILEGQILQVKKDNNLSFFAKVKNTISDIGLGLGLLFLVLLFLLYLLRKLLRPPAGML